MSPELLLPNAALALAELIVLGAISWVAIRVTRLVLNALAQMEPVEGRPLMGEQRRDDLAAHLVRYIKFLSGLGALAIVGYNVWLTAAGFSGPDLIVEHLAHISPRQAWLATGEIVALLVLLRLLSWLGQQFRGWVVDRLKAAEVVRVADERVETLGAHLRHLIDAALWLAGAVVTVSVLELSDTTAYWVRFVFSLPVIWALVRLISDSLDVAIDAIHEGLRTSDRAGGHTRGQQQVYQILGSVKFALRWSVYVAAAAYLIHAAPLGPAAFEFSNNLIRAVTIVVIAQIVLAFGMAVLSHIAAGAEGDPATVRQRRETMMPLLASALRYVIYFIAIVMVLHEFNVDVRAILAGAGIAGIALGFGAQSLVQDVIAGFFTLFDAEYMVGDYIAVGDVEGTVEAITLRETSIRRRDGALAIIPNGQINEVINYSKRYVRAVVDVGVSYEGDLDHAVRVLEEIGRDARKEIADITGPPTVRVVGFNASDIGLRLSVPVRAGRHWDVACQLRHKIKVTFDAEGVEIPFSRHVVILQTADGEPIQELPIRLVDDRGA